MNPWQLRNPQEQVIDEGWETLLKGALDDGPMPEGDAPLRAPLIDPITDLLPVGALGAAARRIPKSGWAAVAKPKRLYPPEPPNTWLTDEVLEAYHSGALQHPHLVNGYRSNPDSIVRAVAAKERSRATASPWRPPPAEVMDIKPTPKPSVDQLRSELGSAWEKMRTLAPQFAEVNAMERALKISPDLPKVMNSKDRLDFTVGRIANHADLIEAGSAKHAAQQRLQAALMDAELKPLFDQWSSLITAGKRKEAAQLLERIKSVSPTLSSALTQVLKFTRE